MATKLAAAVIAVGLMLAYLAPIAWKLKDIALVGVLAIGVVLMLVDLGQSLRGKEE